MSMYLYLLNIFILRKWRRKVKILFWFKGFVWDFHFFHSHFTLKRRELGQQDQSKFFIFSHWKMGTWVSFARQSFIMWGVCVCVCVCVCDGHMYASIRQPLLKNFIHHRSSPDKRIQLGKQNLPLSATLSLLDLLQNTNDMGEALFHTSRFKW